MQAIVAVDENLAIGRAGGMLFRLPEDLKYFARMTRGKALVMGRSTLESFPGGKPLPGRPHIVLSRSQSFEAPGALVARSMRELDEALSAYLPDDVFLVGGGQLYGLLIDCCTAAYVTCVRARAEGADSWFPALDGRPGWQLAEESDEMQDNGYVCTRRRYVNRLVRSVREAETQ